VSLKRDNYAELLVKK